MEIYAIYGRDEARLPPAQPHDNRAEQVAHLSKRPGGPVCHPINSPFPIGKGVGG